MSTQKYEINSYEDEKNSRFSIRTVEKHIELALRTFKEQLGGILYVADGCSILITPIPFNILCWRASINSFETATKIGVTVKTD